MPSQDKLVLKDDFDVVNLRHAKRALERAKFAYDAEQGRASEAAIERQKQSWQP